MGYSLGVITYNLEPTDPINLDPIPDPLLGSLGDSTQSQRDVIFVETTWGQKEPPTRCCCCSGNRPPKMLVNRGGEFFLKKNESTTYLVVIQVCFASLFLINSHDLSSFNRRFSPCAAPLPGINLHLSMYLIPNTGPLGHPYQLVAACQLSKVYVKAS